MFTLHRSIPTLCLIVLFAASSSACADEPVPHVRRISFGNNVSVEIEGSRGETRRVLVETEVYVRDGFLEFLLTRRFTKDHESILVSELDARHLHAALLAAGARPLWPAKLAPKFRAAVGTKIKVSLRYERDGEMVTVCAKEWLKPIAGKRAPKFDWVFGGSQFYEDPADPFASPYYAANEGDVICVSNFEGGLLDVNFESSSSSSDQVFEAHTAKIPPLGTRITVVLEPINDELHLTKAQLDESWKNLDEPNDKGRLAEFTLLSGGRSAVAYLRDKVAPSTPTEAEIQAHEIVKDLDQQSFQVRELASEKLVEMGRPIVWVVAKARESATSLEARRRLDSVLDRVGSRPTPTELRLQRVVNVLASMRGELGAEALEKIAAESPGTQTADLARRTLALRERHLP